MGSMTDTAAEQAAASVNGTGPAAAEQTCEDCVPGGEKAMAVLAGLFGVFIIMMAADMFTGGRISGTIAARASGD